MLEIKDLSKIYNDKTALNNISFSLKKGECLGILGPNGAGKTTLLKIICGLIFPTKGEIIIRYNKRTEIASIFEDHRFLNHLSGIKNIMLFEQTLNGRKNYNWEQLFLQYGLQKSQDVKYKFYSSGMKRRLDLMSVFIEQKSIYVLDEPSNSLDIDSMIVLHQTIIDLKKSKNKTFIVSSHNAFELEKICDHFIIMKEGCIARKITIGEVRDQYESLEKAYRHIFSIS